MKSVLSWLFGMKSFPEGHIEKFRLTLSCVPEGYGIPLLVAFAACSILFALWIYRKRREALGRRRWVLMTLRILALAILFFLLLGPTLEIVAHDTAKSSVLVLADNSMSMTIVDKRPTAELLKRTAAALRLSAAASPEQQKKAAAANRMDILRAVIGDDKQGLASTLKDNFALKFYAFGRDVIQGPSGAGPWREWLGKQGGKEPETRLGSAVETALEEMRGMPVAGIVVLSDGSANSGADPANAIAKAGKRDVPVYFVGIGEPDAKDVQVSFVAMRDIMFLDDPAPISVKLRHWGCTGRKVRLTVNDGSGEVAGSDVVLPETPEITETLTVKPQRKGKFTYTVKAEPIDGELVLDNNQKSKDVRVVDEKIKVLWIEAVPRWEYRYAKNLVKRDKMRFEPNIILFEADPEIRGEDSFFLERFPEKDQDLFKYHLIVIGDVESTRLSDTDMKRLRQYVSKEGGSLIFVAGSLFGPAAWNNTPIEDLLPVVVRPVDARSKADEINSPITKPVRARRTVMGERHPLLFITDDRDVTREAWEKYLLIYNQIHVERAKPGAQVLLETAEDTPKPLIVSSRYGSGTVLYLGTDELWRWRYRPGPLTHDRFWGSVLQQTALARLLGESRRITLQLSREELGVGEEQSITARVLTDTYQPAVEETLELAVDMEEDGRVTQRYKVKLSSIGDKSGLYEGKFLPGLPGRFTAALEYGGEKASAVFRASIPQIEFENPALDRNKLTEWAKLSGGNVYDPWATEELPKEISAKAKASLIRFTDELWDAPLWAFLFILLAGTEWFMRKRENLP